MSPGQKAPPGCWSDSRAAIETERGLASISAIKDSTTDGQSQDAVSPRFDPAFPLLLDASAHVIALGWVDAGVPLCPLQPNTKHLVRTFGPHQNKITTFDDAWKWFGLRKSNLAVVCGNGLIVLDIDTPDVLERTLDRWPELRKTWTVKTRRGVHLYLQGAPLELRSFNVDGLEVKANGSVVTSWPSRVGDFHYTPLNPAAPILPVPADFSLKSEKHPSPPPGKREAMPASQNGDVVTRIKARFDILDLASSVTGLRSSDNRFWHGRCPSGYHADMRPSFWVDVQTQRFGCFACGALFGGDVIELYRQLHKLETVKDAVREMARHLEPTR